MADVSESSDLKNLAVKSAEGQEEEIEEAQAAWACPANTAQIGQFTGRFVKSLLELHFCKKHEPTERDR